LPRNFVLRMEKPMAPEERERMFDKALARHLRFAAPAGATSDISSASASQSAACPDPEMLAAYHERSLLPEQLNSLKEHIVGCANCQTVLAHLEMTDEIPLQSAEEEQVFAQAAASPSMAVSSPAPAASPEVRARRSRRLLLFKGARWQWLAPAGAIAAGLLVWIALHENPHSPLPSVSENETKMAKNQAPPPIPSGAIPPPHSSAPAKPSANLTRPQIPTAEPAFTDGRRASDAAKQIQKLGGAAGARSSDSQIDKELRAEKDRQRDAVVDQMSEANRADLDAKNLPEVLRKKEDAPAQAAKLQAETTDLQNAQIQNQNNNYVSPKVAGPGPMGQMQTPSKAKTTTAAAAAAPAPAAPPAPPAGVGGAVSSYTGTGSLIVARSISNSRLFSSPGSNVFWRVGRSGLIEFSKDGGASWSRQTSGIRSDLLTGSAPSNQVCWIVGRAGAVLLTTDGGVQWKVIPAPLAEDLGGIRATDALHATVWNSRGTKSFETSDGGLTWKPVANP
jgi:hypothetical protein